MHAHVHAYPSRPQFFNLNFVEEQKKKTEPEQRVTCVCSGKQSVNATRSTGTDANCSYMDMDSQFNMIVYLRKNNYMEGPGSVTIK